MQNSISVLSQCSYCLAVVKLFHLTLPLQGYLTSLWKIRTKPSRKLRQGESPFVDCPRSIPMWFVVYRLIRHSIFRSPATRRSWQRRWCNPPGGIYDPDWPWLWSMKRQNHGFSFFVCRVRCVWLLVKQWIVPQIVKLLPKRHIFFDLVIRFITNRKYAFFCIF